MNGHPSNHVIMLGEGVGVNDGMICTIKPLMCLQGDKLPNLPAVSRHSRDKGRQGDLSAHDAIVVFFMAKF